MRHLKCLVFITLLLISLHPHAETDNSLKEKLQKRIRPIGEVTIDTQALTPQMTETDATKSKEKRSGEDIYAKHCSVCHKEGIAGAPKIGVLEAWEPRFKIGLKQLVEQAVTGIRAMPPKGTCSDCDQEEIKEAIIFMLPEKLQEEAKKS